MDATATFPPVSATGSVAAAIERQRSDSVRSVDRAAELLLALAKCDSEVGVTEIARRLGMHKSTASRLLATLELRDLVEQNEETGKYRLGLAMILLGSHAEKMLDLRTFALPELERLARSIRATTALGTMGQDGVVTVAWSAGPGMAHLKTVRSLPLHATAPGKVLLAGQPERVVVQLAKAGFTPYTPHTIVRLDALLAELARVRNRGFATAFGENEAGVNAVAVPVFDHRSAVVAALEARASGLRIQPNSVPEIVESMRGVSDWISSRIGGVVATA